MQIVDGPPVRDRIERLRLQLVLLVLGVVHGGWGGKRVFWLWEEGLSQISSMVEGSVV